MKSDSLSGIAVLVFQEDSEEDEEEEDGIVSSSFGRRSVDLYDLPENERMFLPSNMDATQFSFKFKEVIKRTTTITRKQILLCITLMALLTQSNTSRQPVMYYMFIY